MTDGQRQQFFSQFPTVFDQTYYWDLENTPYHYGYTTMPPVSYASDY